MRRSARWVAFTLAVFLAGGLLFAAGDSPATPGAAPGNPRYVVVTSNGVTFLVDSAEGRTWLYAADKNGTMGWRVLHRFDGDDPGSSKPSAPTTASGPPPAPVPTPAPTPAPTPHPAAETASSGVTSVRLPLEQKGYVRAHLVRTNAGYLALKAKIGSHEIRLMVDTGATHTHFDRKRAERLSLKWEKPPGNAVFAGGTESYEYTFVDSIEVGSFRTGKMRIHQHDMTELNRRLTVYGDPPFDGVLGGDVLDPYWGVIDYKTNDLYLFDRG